MAGKAGAISELPTQLPARYDRGFAWKLHGSCRVARQVARVSPLVLPASRRIRLQRLHRDAIYKEDLAQLVVPVGNGDPAAVLVTLLRELVPSETAPVASAAP